ncbi:MAG TPA: condensation domain-containing protein, partial [Longimicrobiaceae bacterium]|nr:condensation domain-containing protein [Longimicrobiaceae bacterium]
MATLPADVPQAAQHAGEDEVFVFPVSSAQRRLWFLHRLQPDGTLYNVQRSSRLSGPVLPGVLCRAVQAMVDRHELLRTTFAPGEDGEPVQLIARRQRAPFTAVDLRRLDPARRDAEAARLVAAEGDRPFDLAAGPLARFVLATLADGDHVLVTTLHHVITDEQSMYVLARELNQAYESFGRGEEPDFPELPVQYADYAEWEREMLAGSAAAGHLEYWRRRL